MQIGNISPSALMKMIKSGNSKQLSNSMLPQRFAAQVKDIIQGQALLIQGDKTILVQLDTKVKIGEHLLLQYLEKKEGKLFYKVLARSSEPFSYTEEKPSYFYFPGHASEHLNIPPFYLRKLVKDDKEERKPGAANKDKEKNTYEIAIKTENMGVVLIYFKAYSNNNLSFFVYVEDRKLYYHLMEQRHPLLSLLNEKDYKVTNFQVEVAGDNFLDEAKYNLERVASIDQRV